MPAPTPLSVKGTITKNIIIQTWRFPNLSVYKHICFMSWWVVGYESVSPLRTHSPEWILMVVPTRLLFLCLFSQRKSRALLAWACKQYSSTPPPKYWPTSIDLVIVSLFHHTQWEHSWPHNTFHSSQWVTLRLSLSYRWYSYVIRDLCYNSVDRMCTNIPGINTSGQNYVSASLLVCYKTITTVFLLAWLLSALVNTNYTKRKIFKHFSVP